METKNFGPIIGRRGAIALGAGLLATRVSSASAQTAPVKIGVLSDMSSAYADLAGVGAVIAAQMAVEDYGGKVMGRPIQILSGDHQGKPDIGMLTARQWFDDGVLMIADLNSSPVALGVQGLAIEKKRVTLISSAGSAVLTGEKCSPYGAAWTYDTYSIGKSLSSALAGNGATWFFLTLDNAGGTALQAGLQPFVEAAGGKVLGAVRFPLNTADMSSYLLQAQGSGAQYIAVAGGGTDLVNVLKQAREFGIKQTMIGTTVYTTDIQAIGLEAANGLVFAAAWNTDATPTAAAWAKRFFDRHKKMPNDIQVGVYSAVLHYLKGMEAAKSDDAAAVIAQMRAIPVNDAFCTNGKLREDGRMVHDMFLVQAKTPSESSGPWDLLKTIKTIPGDQAFRPMSEGHCPYVKS